MDNQEQPALMKVEDAGRYIGLGRAKMYMLIADGTIPAVRIGGRTVRVARKALDAWIARLTAGGDA